MIIKIYQRSLLCRLGAEFGLGAVCRVQLAVRGGVDAACAHVLLDSAVENHLLAECGRVARHINFCLERIVCNGKKYMLVPKTRYAVTGRVGIVDSYDTLFNKFYRGHSQSAYINLVPQDIFLVIGDMARDDIFQKFKFEHEERLGRVLCKGVKYRTSFFSFRMSEEEAQKNMEKLNACNQYINQSEQYNYHPIPATKRINKALSMLVPGDVVYLEGYLVDVPSMRLKTGTRKDQYHENMIVSGRAPGMCFILYTTKVMLNGRVYE